MIRSSMAVLAGVVFGLFVAVSNGVPANAQGKSSEIRNNEIQLTSFSVPIIRRNRIHSYEYATITMQISDLKRGPEICDKRFHLADAFLVTLHDHPIDDRWKTEDRVAAEQRLQQAAVQMLGAGLIKSMKIDWSRRSRGQRTTFGVYQDILCKGAKD
jgi:hypothetical protein